MSSSRRILILITLTTLAMAPTLAAAADSAEVVERFYDAYRRGDAEAMLSAYSEDAVFEDVNQRHRFAGSEQLAPFLGQIAGLHKTMDIVVDRLLTLGETVVVEYRYTGILSGAALGQALGKEGCPDIEYSLPTTSWYRVSDGKITHQKDFIDLATLLEMRAEATAAIARDAGSSSEGD